MNQSSSPNDKLAQAYDKLMDIMKKAWHETEEHAQLGEFFCGLIQPFLERWQGMFFCFVPGLFHDIH